MLCTRENFKPHRFWFAVFAIGTIASVVYYFWYAAGESRWPGGSSVPGMVFGVLGGAIMLFEFLLWPRKWNFFRRMRIGRTQDWLRAHIWLGLLTIPLILLHSGFTWGGWLSTILAFSFISVIVSGLVGLWLQNILPGYLLELVPGETIYSQIGDVSQKLVKSADEMIQTTLGSGVRVAQSAEAPAFAERPLSENMTPSAPLSMNRRTAANRDEIESTESRGDFYYSENSNNEPLSTMYTSVIRPFLETGSRQKSPLGQRELAKQWFAELRSRMRPFAHGAVNELENWCNNRRQFDLQSRIHWWLHAWLCLHLPFSIVLILLMFVHAFAAIKYW